jgi:hypothetical protein
MIDQANGLLEAIYAGPHLHTRNTVARLMHFSDDQP